jgi:hypothetical protein
MRTYQSLYKDEIRAVEITVNDQDGQPFISDAASASVYDNSGEVVVAIQAAYTVTNRVYTVIGTTVTGTVGKYKIVWKLIKDAYTYYHSTDIVIEEL